MMPGKLGALSAVTASLCCLGPAVLAAIGLGGLGVGAYFIQYSGVLVGIAALLLLTGWRGYFAETRRCRTAQCRMSGGRATLAVLSVASFVVVGFALMHLGPLFSKAACAISCSR